MKTSTKNLATAAVLGAVLMHASAPGAQAPPPGEATDTTSIRDGTRLVFGAVCPQQARFWVEVERLSDLNDAMQRARAFDFVPILAGRSLGSNAVKDIRWTVAGLLGVRRLSTLNKLMQCRAGLCAPSWQDLTDAVLLVELPNADLLAEWFPSRDRIEPRRVRGGMLFQTSTFRVTFKGGIVALSPRKTENALYEQISSQILGTRRVPTWQNDKRFTALLRELTTTAEPDDHPVVTMAFRGEASSVGETVLDTSGLAPFEMAVATLSERDGSLDVDLRASTAPSAERRELSRSTLDTMRLLPDTTLLAWASTVSWQNQARLWQAALQAAPGQVPGRRIEDVVPVEDVINEILPRLGQRLIVVWDRPRSEHPSQARLALLIECDNPRPVARDLDRLVRRRASPAGDGVGTSPPIVTLRRTMHLGVPITTILWAGGPVPIGSSGPASLRPPPPSFAPLGNWLVVALDLDHMRSIIEAHHDLDANLGLLRDVRRRIDRPARTSILAVLQPSAAASVLETWIRSYRTGGLSPLDTSLRWLNPTPTLANLLGIIPAADSTPGIVRVERLTDRAAGGLQTGDRIIGLGGRLLSLQNPESDIETRLARPPAPTSLVLRVERDGTFRDVMVAPRVSFLRRTVRSAIPVMEKFITAGRHVDVACFSLSRTTTRGYAAQISIRFEGAPEE